MLGRAPEDFTGFGKSSPYFAPSELHQPGTNKAPHETAFLFPARRAQEKARPATTGPRHIISRTNSIATRNGEALTQSGVSKCGAMAYDGL